MNTDNEALWARLREIGNDLPALAALYEPVLQQQSHDGVTRHADVAYGADERHQLDVYVPEGTAPAGGWPVVAFFHGGGFIRGNKEHRANIGWFLAQQGFVTVLPNYRLAPTFCWPCGPEDVVAVWSWVQKAVRGYSGDAGRLVLAGESAGAAHVASAVLRREFQPANWSIRAAVLLSGPYNPRLEGMARRQFGIATPDPRNDAYFGTDPAVLSQASVVNHISAQPFPLLIGFTEQDLLHMRVAAGELFARLVAEHRFSPDLLAVPYHNHFSAGYSLGTSDTSLSRPLIDFLSKHTAVQTPD